MGGKRRRWMELTRERLFLSVSRLRMPPVSRRGWFGGVIASLVCLRVRLYISLRSACALRLVALGASGVSLSLFLFHFRWRERRRRFPLAAAFRFFLIIFRGKQKNNAKHSLAAIE